VLLKTEASALDRTVERLAEIHPYEDPAIIGWRCDAASPTTLAWLAQEAGEGR
jgi:periplasmic divalent cation tolerance protein